MGHTYWKNRNEWVCARHLPSINLPASEGQCFFAGCSSVRPGNRPAKNTETVEQVVENNDEVIVTPIADKKPTPQTTKTATKPKKSPKPTKEKAIKLCDWKDCDKGENGGRAEAKSRSKYCSRDCSNKNARWRHKQRKKD